MRILFRRVGRGGIALGLTLVLLSGCGRGGGNSGEVVVSAPKGWNQVDPGRWMVPGKPLRAWEGPDGASLVWYRSLPAPGYDSMGLALAAGNRLQNLPGIRRVSVSPERATGLDVARLEAVGPGTGSAFVPSGTGTPVPPARGELTTTRRVHLILAHPVATSHLVFHAPESQALTLESAVRETLAGLRPSAPGAVARRD